MQVNLEPGLTEPSPSDTGPQNAPVPVQTKASHGSLKGNMRVTQKGCRTSAGDEKL